MNDADIVGPYRNPVLDLCAGLVRERFEEHNRGMELMNQRIERLRQRIEGLVQSALAFTPDLDATIEIKVSTAELTTAPDPADPESIPDPNHEMTFVGYSPMESEIQLCEVHLDNPVIVQPRRPDRTTPGDRIP
jgi:hypothetical protein